MTASLTAMKNVLTPLAKSILVLFVTASATDTTIFCSGTTTLIILIEEKNDFMKIVKSLEKPGLLIKSVSETNENEAK